MGIKSLFKRSKPHAAVFIDFEHWCHSLDNLFGLKPRIAQFYDEISEKYDVKRILFFGNFSDLKLSPFIEDIRQITNSIIETRNPSPRIKKDYTDFIMLDYIYQDVDDHPRTDTYVILSGDGHFSSVATYLKTKKKKRVVIYGVTDATSHQLQKIADEFHLIPSQDNERWGIYKLIIDHMDFVSSQNKNRYPTFKDTIRNVSTKNNLSEDKVQVALRDLLNMKVLKKEVIYIDFQRRITVLKTDWALASEKGLWDYLDARPMKPRK